MASATATHPAYTVYRVDSRGRAAFAQYPTAPEAMAEADRLATRAGLMGNAYGYRYPVVTPAGQEIYAGASRRKTARRTASRAARRRGQR